MKRRTTTPPAYLCWCGKHAWTALTGGYVVLVSSRDVEVILEQTWCATKNKGDKPVYARAAGKKVMHRMIAGARRNQLVDHRDRNGVNNQRDNLRIVTTQQNAANSRPHKGSSRFKGVHFKKETGAWVAYIRVDWKQHHLGSFSSEEEAARAYDAAAIKFFGSYARLNF